MRYPGTGRALDPPSGSFLAWECCTAWGGKSVTKCIGLSTLRIYSSEFVAHSLPRLIPRWWRGAGTVPGPNHLRCGGPMRADMFATKFCSCTFSCSDICGWVKQRFQSWRVLRTTSTMSLCPTSFPPLCTREKAPPLYTNTKATTHHLVSHKSYFIAFAADHRAVKTRPFVDCGIRSDRDSSTRCASICASPPWS